LLPYLPPPHSHPHPLHLLYWCPTLAAFQSLSCDSLNLTGLFSCCCSLCCWCVCSASSLHEYLACLFRGKWRVFLVIFIACTSTWGWSYICHLHNPREVCLCMRVCALLLLIVLMVCMQRVLTSRIFRMLCFGIVTFLHTPRVSRHSERLRFQGAFQLVRYDVFSPPLLA
jgi:phosphatidylglycerophosphate synthase